jgi:hypothetical protein
MMTSFIAFSDKNETKIPEIQALYMFLVFSVAHSSSFSEEINILWRDSLADMKNLLDSCGATRFPDELLVRWETITTKDFDAAITAVWFRATPGNLDPTTREKLIESHKAKAKAKAEAKAKAKAEAEAQAEAKAEAEAQTEANFPARAYAALIAMRAQVTNPDPVQPPDISLKKMATPSSAATEPDHFSTWRNLASAKVEGTLGVLSQSLWDEKDGKLTATGTIVLAYRACLITKHVPTQNDHRKSVGSATHSDDERETKYAVMYYKDVSKLDDELIELFFKCMRCTSPDEVACPVDEKHELFNRAVLIMESLGKQKMYAHNISQGDKTKDKGLPKLDFNRSIASWAALGAIVFT